LTSCLYLLYFIKQSCVPVKNNEVFGVKNNLKQKKL
jgi:hypothetical protein